jgi:hypothetical protein
MPVTCQSGLDDTVGHDPPVGDDAAGCVFDDPLFGSEQLGRDAKAGGGRPNPPDTTLGPDR